jgi:ubiquitin carboxyl-terminal hydrolase 7
LTLAYLASPPARLQGCADIYESFDKYVEVEMLEGDNQYRAEGYGLQDAKKGVIFTKFPPVLHLQLVRCAAAC